MTRFQAFKNGRWVHSDVILAIEPDVNFYRVQAGVYAWADNTQPTTYVAADRGLALGVGVTPPNWTHDAGAGITTTFRTQSAFPTSGANGGDLIVRVGAGDGAGRYGSFSVPGVGANSENFGLASSAAGANSLAVGNAANAPAANSIVVGASAANATFSGTNQVLIGYSVGTALTSGASNTICGADAGDLLTTGGSNCLYGNNAETVAVDTGFSVGIGAQAIVGESSVAVGALATANGLNSVVLGREANGGTDLVTGVVVIGAYAANVTFTGIDNVLIGVGIANGLTSGTLNTICGAFAGAVLETGSNNCLYGSNAATFALDTLYSVGIGVQSVVGVSSVAVGALATAIAQDSVVIGYSADGGTVLATGGIVIGANAVNGTFTGVENVLIGYSVASALTSGTLNTICGSDAGDVLTTGGSNCLYGYNAETFAIDTAQSVGIGYNSVTASNSVVIGYSATTNTVGVTVIGSNAVAAGATQTVIGNSAKGGTGADGVIIGYAAANSGSFSGGNCVIIGNSTASNITSGNLNTILGSDSGDLLTTGSQNVLVGFNCETSANSTSNAVAVGSVIVVASTSVAIGDTVTASAVNSVVIGCLANGGTSAATNGVVIGDNAANGGFSGIKNVLIGSSVATALTTGTLNTICGSDAGDLLTTGSNNCLYGNNAETVANSTANSVGIGHNVVVAATAVAIGSTATANAANSVVIGYSAKGGTAAATNGVVIGDNAANVTFTGDKNVLIGFSVATALTSGTLNTICGADAGDVLTTGLYNCLYGYDAETFAANTTQGVGIGSFVTVGAAAVAIGSGAKANPALTVVIGYSAKGGTVAAQQGVIIGTNAANDTFVGIANVLIGSSVASALDTGTLNTICGAYAGSVLTTGSNNCLYGYDVETVANSTADAVGIGANVVVAASSIVIGSGATTTASNQFVAGSSAHPMNNVYFGKGVNNAAPTSYTINGTASTGAAAGGDLVIAGGVSAAGVGGSIRIQTAIGAGLADRQVVSPNGNFTFTQAINTTGSPTFALWTGAAHTTLTATVEAIDIDFALNRLVTFSAGAITTQRAFVVRAPIYNVGANTITTAATFAITDAPSIGGGGGGGLITNALAFWVQAGKSQFADHVTLLSDSAAIQLGAGIDMSVYYNGTNGIINTSLIAASDLTLTCGAQKTLVLTNTVYNDANVGGATLRGGSTNPPITQIVDNVGTNTGIYALGFDLNDEANGCIEIPHDYAEGTNLVFHVHWFGNTAPAGGTDNVKWQVTYSVCRDGVTTPPATTPAGTEVAYTTQYSHVRTDLATINGATFKIGDQVHFNVKRIAASADDYAGLTLLDTAGFHYQCDTMGSRQITAK